MKQIIIVSDSHRNNEALIYIQSIYPNAFLYLHAGDSEEDSRNIFPFISVKGNNDYLIDNEKSILSVGTHKIYMTHGHKMYLTLENMARKAKIEGCDIFIYGHTHKPMYEVFNGVTIINPGALNYPRTPLGQTYAILLVNDDESISVEIKQLL